MSLIDFINDFKLKRFESKMKEYKPLLLSKWYDQQEEVIRKEYEAEMEKLESEVYSLQQDLKDTRRNAEYYKGKYEGVIETQDKVREQLISKVESTATDKGKLKQEVKHLKDDAKTEVLDNQSNGS